MSRRRSAPTPRRCSTSTSATTNSRRTEGTRRPARLPLPAPRPRRPAANGSIVSAAPDAVGALPARKAALLAGLLGSLLVLSLWVTRAPLAVPVVADVIIALVAARYVPAGPQLRRLLLAVLVTAALIAAYAWWQIPSGIRPSAPFEGPDGEPNTLGGYLVLVFSVPCALALTLPGEMRRLRRSSALLSLFVIPPLLATLSRSSWIGLSASLLTLVFLSPKRRTLIGAVIVASTLLFFVHPKSIEDRVLYTFQ